MDNGKYLADTNIIIDYIKNVPKVQAFVDKHRRDFIIPYITYGEVIQGVKNQRELKEISKFLSTFDFDAGSSEISRLAVDIVKSYRLKIGINFFDSILAATAIVNEYTLVTHNIKHFKGVDDVKLLDVLVD